MPEENKMNQLRRIIHGLPAPEKAIIQLYLEEKTYEEMELILGIKQINLRVKISRIKEKLKRIHFASSRF